MASSFYSNSVHVDFESALAMGEPVEFFANGTVRDGLVVSTVNGVTIEISEKLFTETFDLPVDGLADIFEIPKDKIFDARSIVSLTREPVTLSGLKSQMKMHYRLLCDIMAKSISVKAGSFNAITVETFSLLTAVVCDVKINWGSVLFGILKKMVTPGTKQAKGFAIQISLLLESVPNLQLGESSEFPSSKILTVKTIHRYIAVIDKSGAQEPADAPKVKKAPSKKVASKKRPADIPLDVPVVKRKRTSKKKSTLEIVVVAQEAIPILSVPVSPAVEPMVEDQQAEFSKEQPADELPTDKSAASTEERHWFDLSYEALIAKWATERTVTSPADTDEEIETPVDDPDTVINHVLQQLDSTSADQCVTSVVEGAESLDVGTAGGAQQVKFSEEEPMEKSVDAFISVDETMSLDDILYSIPEEVSLPSTGVEFPADHRGKEPLIEKNPIKGNPVMEQITLILADIDCLLQVRAKLVDEVAIFFYSFSFKRLANLQIDDSYFDKEELVLTWAEAELTGIALQRRCYILLNYREVLLRKFLEVRKMNFKPSEGSSAIDLKILDQLYDIHLFILEELKKETQAHGLIWKKTCCSKIFEGRPRDRGAVIARTNSNTPSKCWIRTMLRVNGTWAIEPCADYWVKIPQPDVHYEISRRRQYDYTLPSCSFSRSIFDNVDGVSAGYQSHFRRKLKLIQIRSFTQMEKIRRIVQLPGIKETRAPTAGSKPRPAEKPGKPENTYRQQYISPRGTSGSNPSTESNTNSIRKETDTYANAMQDIKATTESREPKDRNNSSTARSDQRKDNHCPRRLTNPAGRRGTGFTRSASEVYGNYPLVLEYIILHRAYTSKHIIHSQSYAVNKLTSVPQFSEQQSPQASCHNDVPSTQIYHLLNGNTKYLRDRSTENSSWELRTPPVLPYLSNSTESSKKLRVRSFTYPRNLGAKSDAYANRLHKGDVFAHLTNFKQTSESNIQTKRLSKRSPTLPLLLSSELPTTACLDWSRHEDIQARTVKGRLNWTGRRYQAGTERTTQAQLQTKGGADSEVAPEDQLEDENKEDGEEKERALQKLMKQPVGQRNELRNQTNKSGQTKHLNNLMKTNSIGSN
ncbi:hypothetical protein F511_11091 [Dorcoceras hygrometricum]|uniref:Dystroglycan-like n=1 Tax=Dorcoceras hygrometricum TaxID=472368 RepID=A0A2Z7A901_9LAMI|nr:hypothetical protein F511_11091 [Dorcoceras hygrometricum]